MAKKKEEIIEEIENIITQTLDDLMGDRFGVYAKEVILNRAIPDVRDGLKPVQRRIIFSMYKEGMFFDKPTKKCARITGTVIGRFHPHGDQSVYEALTRMSQPWKMNVPLIDFQGNNGSIDGDSPAHQRYTEARLAKVSSLLIKNIEKDNIVDFTLNYSDEELEPIVLPSYLPNLLINGSEGIAVALATRIPPHNLSEVCEAAIYRLENPTCSLDELLEIVKGPDLPTGAIIYTSDQMKKMYETGRGKFDIVARFEENKKGDANELIVREIPFGVDKIDIVKKINEIIREKEVDGITDVKDFSAGDEINIVITLKKDIDPKIIIQYLFNRTKLKVTYNANIVAICENHPKTLGLIEYLDIYINHLTHITVKSFEYDLEKAKLRLHIVEGLIKAISIIDEIIKAIRNSIDKDDARTKLMDNFGFSKEQAEAILNIRLYRLSHTDVNVYIKEKEDLDALVKKIEGILNSKTKLRNSIVNDLKDVVKEYGYPRRSEIKEEEKAITIDKRDLVAKEDVYVVLTHDGYIKRSSIKSYKACEGQLAGIKAGDSFVMSELASTLDYILAFTNFGNYLFIPVHTIVENKWKDEGKHVNYLTNLPLDEYIIKAIVVNDFSKDVSIAMISKNGQIKKTKLKEFYATRYSKPIRCMRLSQNDEMVDISVLNNNSDLLVIAESGLATFFNENEFSHTGIKSSGVKAIARLRNSSLKCILSFRKDEKDKLLFLTDKGMYRIYDPSNLELTARLGAGQFLFKSFKSAPHKLVFSMKIKDKTQPTLITGLYENNELFNINIDDYHLTPVDKYCKKNIDSIPEDSVIKCVFNYHCQIIDKDTVVEESPIKDNGDDNSGNNDNGGEIEEQLSLSFGDDSFINEPLDEKEVIKEEIKKESVKEEVKTHSKNKKTNDEDDGFGYEQISIFDDMGD